MRAPAGGQGRAGIGQEIVGGTEQYADSLRVSQPLTGASPQRSHGTTHDILANLRAACEARTGAFANPAVQADRCAIAPEGQPGGAP